MSAFFRRRNVKEKVDDTTFLRNGATLLERLITSCNGKRNPITSFSAEELKLATDDYDAQQLLTDTSDEKLYKGLLQKRPISVIKIEGSEGHEYCFKNIVFASQTSHKNILKLIGCCLGTEIPILVFESVEYGTLADRFYGHHQPYFEPLLWKHRLKIAMEIANAVTYLHIGLPRPIVFTNIKPSKILFDEHHVAKLFDFSLSESIPEGETHIKEARLRGTLGLLAPEFYCRCDLNEKYDVYSFGGLLLVLLTGQKIIDHDRYETGEEPSLYNHVKKYNENNRINEIVDRIIVQDGSCLEREQQLHTFTELALKCMSLSPEERPEMINVAKQLRKLYLSA